MATEFPWLLLDAGRRATYLRTDAARGGIADLGGCLERGGSAMSSEGSTEADVSVVFGSCCRLDRPGSGTGVAEALASLRSTESRAT